MSDLCECVCNECVEITAWAVSFGYPGHGADFPKCCQNKPEYERTHFRKGLLWITWCGKVPDQCDARIEDDLDDVTCKTCKRSRDIMGNSPDVLERAECHYQGHLGHQLCGFCEEHREPRILCKCRAPLKYPNHDPKEE